MSFSKEFLEEIAIVAHSIDANAIDKIVDVLVEVKANRGRVFVIGVGGSAGNGSHLTNDFRKLCNIETYCVTDNVSELTARINDEGWDVSFVNILKTNNLTGRDCLFVLSVGGGSKEKNVSVNLIKAMDFAKVRGCKIAGIVSRDGGYAAQVGDAVIIVPSPFPVHVTPISESFQAVIWHLLVSHPNLQVNATTW